MKSVKRVFIFNRRLPNGILAFGVAAAVSAAAALPKVELRRVPDGGIQPETGVDTSGAVHLVYFKGDPAGGDIFYTKSVGGLTFSKPVRVNSIGGTAVALGNIRGARIAVGRDGHVYVVWNGSQTAAKANGGRAPMLFARLNDSGTAFEGERNLIRSAYGIDGGGAVAADRMGRVYVFWHAPMAGREGEQARRVWMAESRDDGKTFDAERVAWNEPVGACGCCSLDAFAGADGRLFVLFRSAHEMVHRDIYLLVSNDHGNTFSGSDVSKWNVGYCVMSAEAFTSGPSGTLAAWETERQVHFGRVNLKTVEVTDTLASSDGAGAKYPALSENRHGFRLVSWTEGMGWKRGGSLRWQLFDSAGGRVGEEGNAAGVPAWSLVACYARRDGSFVILY